MKWFRSVAVIALVTAPTGAQAQTSGAGSAPAETSPTAADEPALCTDRPTKSNSVCTVPEGAIQIESDLVNWTRFSDAGVRVTTLQAPIPQIKYGLGPNTDIQAAIAPYVRVSTRAGRSTSSIEGVSDLVVRLKQRFTDPDAKLQVGLIPFIKVPTAKRGIGNREWEGGVALPIQYSLPAGMTLTFGPEIDLLHDSDGRGKNLQYVGTVNLGVGVAPNVTLYGELWTAQNDDPAGSIEQYSADVALAWLARPRLQFDVGANFGLNRQTPDAQLYFGVSTRF